MSKRQLTAPHAPDSAEHERHDPPEQLLQRLVQRFVADRKVRAVAQLGSFDTEQAWQGSVPQLLTFERGLEARQIDYKGGIRLERWPYAHLEEWRDWQTCRTQAPLAQLATSRVVYDPTGYYARIQRMLWNLGHAELAVYRQELLLQASEQLTLAQQGQGSAAPLLAVVQARSLATELIYPALLTHLHAWPEFFLRLPHAWRAVAGMRFPKAVYGLEQLYGFAGAEEARKVLLATRGMGMLAPERQARLAVQAGYYDGAVRYLRDEAARLHVQDIQRWDVLSSTRRDKLSTLLGLTRAPLGMAALELAEQLITNTQQGK